MSEPLEFKLSGNLPKVFVTFHGPKGRRSFYAVVDTGSRRCVLPLAIARKLGVDINKSDPPDGKITGFNGATEPYWLGSMPVRLSDGDAAYTWTVEIAFADAIPDRAVLGGIDFLEFFTTTFEGDSRRLSFRPNKNYPGDYESRKTADES
jgi:hypothetical protein